MEFPLTPKQKKILDYITDFAHRKGYAPSQQEIATHFRFKSLGTVQNYLVRLERHGALKKTWNARRSLTLKAAPPISNAAASIELQLLGRVAAGKPIEAIDAGGTVDVPASMLKRGEHYVLQVVGDSMIEDGILSGDLVVVNRKATANNGQTVVALVNNEATVKRYYAQGKRVELRPANSAYRPLVIDSLVDGMDFRIEGIVVGVIRKLSA